MNKHLKKIYEELDRMEAYREMSPEQIYKMSPEDWELQMRYNQREVSRLKDLVFDMMQEER